MALGQLEDAARLFGAAEMVDSGVAAMEMPDLRAFLANVRHTVAESLGEPAYALALAEGRQMTQEQYNALARANFRAMVDKEFGPAKTGDQGKSGDQGKGGDTKDGGAKDGGGQGIAKGEKDPTGGN